MRSSWIVSLIIITCPFVNAASFRDQVKKVIATGESSSITSSLADSLGFERNLPYRAIETQDSEGYHDFGVILKNDNPLCIVVMISSDTASESESRIYRVSPNGKLEKAFRDFGRFDADHKPIRGSGVITDLKLTKEVRAAFRREMDFWLRPAASASRVTPVR